MRNTEYILGVIIYTGYETKIMKNSKDPKSKVSKLIKTINKILYSLIIVQITICILFAYLSLNWQEEHSYFLYFKIVLLINLG